MQAPVLFSHDEPVPSRNFVDAHGELHHHSIECQKDVQHLPGITFTGGLIAQFAQIPLVLRNLVHSAIHSVTPKLEIANQTPKWKSKQFIVVISANDFPNYVKTRCRGAH